MNAGPGERGDAFVWPPGRRPAPPPPPESDPNPIVFEQPHWLDESWPRRPSALAQAVGEIERVLLGGGPVSLQARAVRTGWRPERADRACWRCGESVGAFEVDDTGCATCQSTRPPWSRFVRLSAYDALARDAIHELKFQARRGVGVELGRLLGRRLRYEVETQSVAPGAIVPVPISVRRRIQRGVDHTAVLARGAAGPGGLEIAPVLRRSHRPSQLSVPRSGRETNVRGSIRPVKRPRLPEDGVVVVLDDVRTSGATMRAACRAVGSLGVERERIWACVVGVRDAPERRSGPGEGGEPCADAGEDRKVRESFSGED